MSAKRIQILIGFAALAVVLVVAILVVRPTFRSEEATGAIGAVQKHHAPQITKADVVLGDEQQKRQQKVLFADYLADANELKSFGAAQDRAQIQARIDNMATQVNARFESDFSDALSLAEKLASDDTLSVASREQALGLIALLNRSAATANHAEIANRFAELANGLRAASQVDMKSLDMASLASAQRSLDAISRADLASQLKAKADYLGMMANESAMLASASGGDYPQESISLHFNKMAADLQERAAVNARAALESETEEIAALGRLSELASRADAQNKAQAESLTRAIDNRSVAIEANLDAMSSVAGNRMYASMLGDSDTFMTQVRALGDEVANLGSRFRAVRDPGHGPSDNQRPVRNRAVPRR